MSVEAPWERLDPRTLATQPVAIGAKALVPMLAGFIGVGSAVGFNIAIPLTIGDRRHDAWLAHTWSASTEARARLTARRRRR